MVPVQTPGSEPEVTPKLDLSDEEMRPIAIHVEKITDDLSLKHIYRKRVAVIDLELSHAHASQLMKMLEKSLLKKHGSIRIRIKGRMVLE